MAGSVVLVMGGMSLEGSVVGGEERTVEPTSVRAYPSFTEGWVCFEMVWHSGKRDFDSRVRRVYGRIVLDSIFILKIKGFCIAPVASSATFTAPCSKPC